ncbi:hypothetical protein PsorP6_012274 [Peronosclerospora sorghi]|uniref:Uncharacterized protein n=1 Tax=Peronosclerospora sorghi TaxID=230839 RepID=A0ACC0WJT7_9STRA|nr:hypothetical protein PsorP6_012274 [Peronosclerospora sorghi]
MAFNAGRTSDFPTSDTYAAIMSIVSWNCLAGLKFLSPHQLPRCCDLRGSYEICPGKPRSLSLNLVYADPFEDLTKMRNWSVSMRRKLCFVKRPIIGILTYTYTLPETPPQMHKPPIPHLDEFRQHENNIIT